MLASFFAAFMSTLSTYLNLSSAYFVNDFYRPFVKREATEKHYIKVSRIATLVLSIVTGIVTYYTTSIIGVFKFLIAFGSGTGLVYIVRWFWWRVNAWSEISAMVASTGMTLLAYLHPSFRSSPYYAKLFLIISVSTIVWLGVTLLTKPAENAKLVEFYRRTRPGRAGWKPVALLADDPQDRGALTDSLVQWIYGCLLIIGLTIGLGKLILGYILPGSLWLCVAAVSGWLVCRGLRKMGWNVLG